ncbi:MAG: YMGG-like glycine zipper-containing protein [Litorimonas sp.]
MTHILKLASLGLASVAFAACTTTGNVERNAAGGAAAGAAIGAGVGAVSGDVKVGEGAVAGAVVGGIVGAVRGNKKDKDMNGGTTSRPNLDKTTRYYDDVTGRYYYYEQGTSRTFYENYESRS